MSILESTGADERGQEAGAGLNNIVHFGCIGFGFCDGGEPRDADPADTADRMSEVSEILGQQLRRLSVDEYIALADTGAFDGEKVEVFREPRNGEWAVHFVLGPTDTIRPVAFPDAAMHRGFWRVEP